MRCTWLLHRMSDINNYSFLFDLITYMFYHIFKYIVLYGLVVMKNLSISLSKDLIIDSDEVAKELGVTRTEFIRQAVIHELKNFKIKNVENNMIKSFEAMKKSKEYLIESEELNIGFGCDLKNNDIGEWWKK